ncbi:hypothetical protein B0H63DRAFT_482174 [Podospora didyma]|uniref:Uncharacterized protein n=1 Tax=Podospora didyma TaxID=330526 RepID=A0AAE0KG43_9PEZI|nr:hypothetical protein B0H63DRAFT_482174 [Podospora didyma]
MAKPEMHIGIVQVTVANCGSWGKGEGAAHDVRRHCTHYHLRNVTWSVRYVDRHEGTFPRPSPPSPPSLRPRFCNLSLFFLSGREGRGKGGLNSDARAGIWSLVSQFSQFTKYRPAYWLKIGTWVGEYYAIRQPQHPVIKLRLPPNSLRSHVAIR